MELYLTEIFKSKKQEKPKPLPRFNVGEWVLYQNKLECIWLVHDNPDYGYLYTLTQDNGKHSHGSLVEKWLTKLEIPRAFIADIVKAET